MKGNVFIKRPVMAISISVLILAIGLISLFTLPVEQYPDIAPPTVYVTASYTGADAEAVMNSVIMPLEESINGVEDMMYISSSASNAGLAIIQVYFKQGTDPDMAAVNVQNRVAKAQGLLPAEVTKVGVSTMKRQTSFLQIGALVCTDGRYDQTFLANYLDINCLLYTSDAADDLLCVDLGGRRNSKKKKKKTDIQTNRYKNNHTERELKYIEQKSIQK